MATRKVAGKKTKITAKTTAKTIIKKAAVCPDTFNEFVQTRAYHLWEKEGAEHGSDTAHWTQAIKDISKKYTIK